MLVLDSSINQKPIISLKDGEIIATITKPLINPDNLTLPAFYCLTRNRQLKIILDQDIREINFNYLMINDESNLSDPNDLIRLQNIININYNLINKSVETISRKKIGRVTDFTINLASMYVNNLEVTPSIYRNFRGSNLKIHRSQIIELNDRKIIIEDLDQKIKSGLPLPIID